MKNKSIHTYYISVSNAHTKSNDDIGHSLKLESTYCDAKIKMQKYEVFFFVLPESWGKSEKMIYPELRVDRLP